MFSFNPTTYFYTFCNGLETRNATINNLWIGKVNTAWKVSKYGVFSGPYFPVIGLSTGKYGLEKTPYFDTFHAVKVLKFSYLSSDFMLKYAI